MADSIDYKKLTAHKFADVFPMLSNDDHIALADDIKLVGLTDKIILFDGKILDGRNRYKALCSLGLEHREWHYQNFETIEDFINSEISPLDYVISKNLIRRHLDESQRAMAASNITNMKQGERTDLRKKAPFDDTEHSANLLNVSVKDAAKKFNVSERMVTSAKQVNKSAAPELKQLVNDGDIPVSVAEPISRLPIEDQQQAVKDNAPKELKNFAKKTARMKRQKDQGEKQLALPSKKYGVIVADPEWKFDTRSGNGMDRSADNHYSTSELNLIMERRVEDIAADDCVLFMWATVPMLMEAICVLDAWGFAMISRDPISGFLKLHKERKRYVSSFAWVKEKAITGYWNRGKHEILLIATRGKPVAPAMGTQMESVLSGDNSQHSKKPEILQDWIDKIWPDTPKIELNARRQRENWDIWGNEAPDAASEPIQAKQDDIGALKEIIANPDVVIREKAPTASDPKKNPIDPESVVYEGKHTEATDAVIIKGYRDKQTIVMIAALLGLPATKVGVIKGRASRLGLTSKANLIASNKKRTDKNASH